MALTRASGLTCPSLRLASRRTIQSGNQPAFKSPIKLPIISGMLRISPVWAALKS